MFRMHAFSRSHKEMFHTSKHLIFSLKRGEHGSQDVLNRVIFLGIQSSYISYDYVIFFFYMGSYVIIGHFYFLQFMLHFTLSPLLLSSFLLLYYFS